MTDKSLTNPIEWKNIPLSDLLLFIVDNRGKSVPTSENGIKLIATNCIKNSNLYPVYENIRYVDKSIYDSWFRSHPKYEDVILVTKGSPGQVALVPKNIDFCIAQDMVSLRANRKIINPYFLYYSLKLSSTQTAIRNLNVGSLIPHFKKTNFKELIISIPPLEIQEKIVNTIFPIDQKIELLREQNKTLEATAQAIFKEWFVKFNFPGSNGKMVDSELGKIPEEWKVGKLSEIANFLNGLALQKYQPESSTEYLPVVKIKELNSGISEQSDRASARLDKKYIVEDGDILFSWSGSLLVDIWKYGKGALNQHLFKVTSDSYPKWFYFYWIKEHLPSFQQTASAKAVTMGHIQRHHLDDALVVIPNDQFMQIANNLFDPMISKLINNNAQIKTLSKLRDITLPKLMKGDLRVKGFSN